MGKLDLFNKSMFKGLNNETTLTKNCNIDKGYCVEYYNEEEIEKKLKDIVDDNIHRESFGYIQKLENGKYKLAWKESEHKDASYIDIESIPRGSILFHTHPLRPTDDGEVFHSAFPSDADIMLACRNAKIDGININYIVSPYFIFKMEIKDGLSIDDSNVERLANKCFDYTETFSAGVVYPVMMNKDPLWNAVKLDKQYHNKLGCDENECEKIDSKMKKYMLSIYCARNMDITNKLLRGYEEIFKELGIDVVISMEVHKEIKESSEYKYVKYHDKLKKLISYFI